MFLQGEKISLVGNVKAIRGNDTLTCRKAIISKKPEWMLATLTPRLYRDENVPQKKVRREITLDAENIFWANKEGRFEASPSVVLKIEETTWDKASYTWVIIKSDEMEGFRENRQMKFRGNIRIQDKSRFGKGNFLDYDKASSTVTLHGDAYIETEKWSSKEKKMVKEIITGQKIIYNFETKQAWSE